MTRIDLGRLPRWWLVVAAAVPLVLVAAWAGGSELAWRAVRVGEPAPDFALADLDGNPIRLADYAGRPVVLNFWASWCLPCVNEFSLFQAELTEHADERLTVIGIVYRDRSEAAREFAEQRGADWPLVMDPGEGVARSYGVFGPPESWLIDRDGRVFDRQIGPYSAEELAADIDRLLAAGADEE